MEIRKRLEAKRSAASEFDYWCKSSALTIVENFGSNLDHVHKLAGRAKVDIHRYSRPLRVSYVCHAAKLLTLIRTTQRTARTLELTTRICGEQCILLFDHEFEPGVNEYRRLDLDAHMSSTIYKSLSSGGRIMRFSSALKELPFTSNEKITFLHFYNGARDLRCRFIFKIFGVGLFSTTSTAEPKLITLYTLRASTIPLL